MHAGQTGALLFARRFLAGALPHIPPKGAFLALESPVCSLEAFAVSFLQGAIPFLFCGTADGPGARVFSSAFLDEGQAEYYDKSYM